MLSILGGLGLASVHVGGFSFFSWERFPTEEAGVVQLQLFSRLAILQMIFLFGQGVKGFAAE